MTVIRQPFAIPKNARIISYNNEDYSNDLSRLFQGALSLDDIRLSLGTPWNKIANGVFDTSDNLVLKNLSDEYFYYHIQVMDLLVDTTTNAEFSMQLSTDNGSTYITGATDYFYARRVHSSTSVSTIAVSNTVNSKIECINGITTNHVLKTSSANGEQAVIDIYLKNPMDTRIPTSAHWILLRGSTDGTVVFSEGNSYLKSVVATNTIKLFTNASVTFTSGTWDLYGLRRAS